MNKKTKSALAPSMASNLKTAMASQIKPSMVSQLKQAVASVNTIPERNRAPAPVAKGDGSRNREIFSIPCYPEEMRKLTALTLHLMRNGFGKNESLVVKTAIQRVKINAELLEHLTPEPDETPKRKNFSVQQPELEHIGEIVKFLYKNGKTANAAEAGRVALRLAEPDDDFVKQARDLEERYDHRRK